MQGHGQARHARSNGITQQISVRMSCTLSHVVCAVAAKMHWAQALRSGHVCGCAEKPGRMWSCVSMQRMVLGKT